MGFVWMIRSSDWFAPFLGQSATRSVAASGCRPVDRTAPREIIVNESTVSQHSFSNRCCTAFAVLAAARRPGARRGYTLASVLGKTGGHGRRQRRETGADRLTQPSHGSNQTGHDGLTTARTPRRATRRQRPQTLKACLRDPGGTGRTAPGPDRVRWRRNQTAARSGRKSRRSGRRNSTRPATAGAR